MNPPIDPNPNSNSLPRESTKNPEDLWTTKDVGKFFHISGKSVFELRKKRGLPYVKIGGAVRFLPQEIRDYLVNSRRLSSHRLRQIARKGPSA